jgi:hypothetical protein
VIDALLRPPRSPAEWVTDLLRVFALVSVVAAAIWWSAQDAGILALALPAVMVPRLLGIRAWFDIGYCVIVLTAAWSNVLGLYDANWWWDLLIHFLCAGVLAAALYLALVALRVVPEPAGGARTPIGFVTTIGLAIGSLWEMVEWLGHTYVSNSLFVSYDDTIGDMAMGGLGALAASALVASVPLRRGATSRTASSATR